jgi:hypothetical protein
LLENNLVLTKSKSEFKQNEQRKNQSAEFYQEVPKTLNLMNGVTDILSLFYEIHRLMVQVEAAIHSQ